MTVYSQQSGKLKGCRQGGGPGGGRRGGRAETLMI
jgi:hypothetical protein